ncbi:hypothetical protein, partial [Microbacterium sp.]|uniref:hypothetical protein n=1 Tax=Microbacterium sp. TaxID=51671 RepID=UPI003A84980E
PAPILSDPLTEVSGLQPACWPLAARVVFEAVAELLRSLCCLLAGVLLLGALGLDAFRRFGDGKAAQLVGLGADQSGLGAGVVGVAVRVGDEHAEVVAAYSFGPRTR